MAKEQCRPRGRPKGTGKDDSAALNRIAELLVTTPSLKPTTAIKRIGIRNESDVRRLQVKWKAEGPALLNSARIRQRQVTRVGPMADGFRGFLAAASAIEGHVEAFRRTTERQAAEVGQLTAMAKVATSAFRIAEKQAAEVRQFAQMANAAFVPTQEFWKQLEEQGRIIRQALDPLSKFP